MDTIAYAKKGESSTLEHLNPEKSMFLYGPSSIRQKNYGVHPLEKSEKSYYDREQFTRASVLRSVQGIHAPLRLLAERRAAGKVGHLPCLPRSNLMADVLDGRDELLLPEDIFNNPNECCEVSLPPHLAMERQLGIL